MNRAYGSYLLNELLVWDILKWGQDNGYRRYDFGGAGRPEEKYGVRDFKGKFGGDLVCYGRNVCVHAPVIFRLCQWGYKPLRHLFWR
jgi:lipid II:glycine glycyltransferase (peptidoglycan interpeptide bridge formation enzyme)